MYAPVMNNYRIAVEQMAILEPALVETFAATCITAIKEAYDIAVYADPAALPDNEQLDFVDICTNVETHYPLTKLAAERGLPVVCQKPMATTLAECETLVQVCKDTGVPLHINENWRWQYQIRSRKES
jgi:predicted dehydrogenase